MVSDPDGTHLVSRWDVPLNWHSFGKLVLARLLPLAIIANLFALPADKQMPEYVTHTVLTLMIVSALLIAPIVESLIFLFVFNLLGELRWDVLNTLNKRRVVCVVLCPLFGLVHFRDVYQTVILAMAGYVFMRILVEQRNLGMTRNGFWWCTFAHCFFNGAVIALGLWLPLSR